MINWKGQGQTFNQLVSGIRMNKRTTPSFHNIFKALPAKHYRKEIASVDTKVGGVISVDEMLRPSGAIKTTTNLATGLCTSTNINPPNNTSEYPPTSDCIKNICGKDGHARQLVRSAGNARHVGKASPISSYHQYLVSRRRTYEQNSYHHPTEISGEYRGNGACIDEPCLDNPIVYYNPSNTKFKVQGGVSSSSRVDRLKLDTVLQTAHQSSVHTTANTLIVNARTVKGRINIENKKVQCAL